jgi:hypothetical protein
MFPQLILETFCTEKLFFRKAEEFYAVDVGFQHSVVNHFDY